MKKSNVSLEKIGPIIDKIEQLSKVQRIMIYVFSFLILIGSFVYFAYLPKYKEIGKLEKEYTKVSKKLTVAKKNAKQLNSWRAKMKKKEAQFKLVMQALPEKKEIPSLLANVSQSGKDAGLEFMLFQPKPEVLKDFYAEIPVSIQVTGNYHQVAIFFDKVSKLSRIVNIKDIDMAPGKADEKLTTSCTAVTYKFLDQPRKPAKDAKGKKKKAKAAKTKKKKK